MSGIGLTSDDMTRLEQSFIVGLSRSPMPAVAGLSEAADPRLAALAILGQRKRFRPPRFAAADTTAILPEDGRPVLPDAARPILRQIMTGSRPIAWDVIAEAVADRVNDAGLRFHPFDLPWLAKHLKEMHTGHRLGPTEAAWLARAKDKAEVDIAGGDIDDETWGRFQKSDRLGYLRRRRGADPAAARTLLESVFANETASLRAHLLSGLEVGLGPEDRSFLEQALTDRAKSVRDAATSLMSRIPGTSAYEERRDAAMAAIEFKAGGMFSRGPKLKYRHKEQRPAHQLMQTEASNALDGISLGDLAERFDIPKQALLRACADDDMLRSALLKNAAHEGLWDLILDSADAGSAGWADIVLAVHDVVDPLPPERRRAFVADVLNRDRFTSFEAPIAFVMMYRILGRPLDDPQADDLLASAAWRALIDDIPNNAANSSEAQSLSAITPLIPASRSDRFLAGIDPLPREIKLRPALYHRFVAALDTQIRSQEQDINP